jgi:hypothetical protein
MLQPGHGARQLTEIVETLTFVKPNSPHPVSGLLRGLSTRINPGQVCYLVTTGLPADLAQACREAENRRIDLRVICLNRASFALKPARGETATAWQPERSLVFNYGDGLARLVDIL